MNKKDVETRLARSMAEHCAKTVHDYESFLEDLVTTVENDSSAMYAARVILNRAESRAAVAARARSTR